MTNHSCTKFLQVQAKTSDCCNVSYDSAEHGELMKDGYVPRGLGIGGGDYIDFSVCVECGKLKDWKPLAEETIADELGDYD